MIARSKERALISQTIIDLVKIVRVGRLGRVHSVETLLISAAIVAGDAAGRPRNATEMARQLGFARTTVLRKLAELERAGLAERRGSRYHRKDMPPDTRYIDEALAVLRRAKISDIG